MIVVGVFVSETIADTASSSMTSNVTATAVACLWLSLPSIAVLFGSYVAMQDLDKASQLGAPVDKQALRELQTSGNTVNPYVVLGVTPSRGRERVPCDPDHASRVWR